MQLRVGTRGSTLAVTQTGHVQAALEDAGVSTSREVLSTRGDRSQAEGTPLPEIGGKGLFTEELDRALLERRIDLAVHSLKDLPTEEREGLRVAAIPAREDPRDVLVGPAGSPVGLRSLPRGSVLGTSSLRRRALTLAFRPDLEVRPIRGNLDTRIRKVDAGQVDALVVAAAGLRRLGLTDRVGEWLERTAWLPAPGQGALGIVVRADDRGVLEALEPLRDPETEGSVVAERAVLHALGGGCQLPLGALGIPYDGRLRLWALVASVDGTRVVRGDVTGDVTRPRELGRRLADLLLERGAGRILETLDDAPEPVITPP